MYSFFFFFNDYLCCFFFSPKLKTAPLAFSIAYREAFCFTKIESKTEELLLIIWEKDKSSSKTVLLS